MEHLERAIAASLDAMEALKEMLDLHRQVLESLQARVKALEIQKEDEAIDEKLEEQEAKEMFEDDPRNDSAPHLN